MADDEQDVWEQAAKTYKGGTAPSSTPPQASSNQDSSSQASPSNDPWEKAAKTFKANPSQGASSEWDKPEPSFLEKVGNAAGKVGDVAGAAFKGLASLAPSMGGSHIAQPTMGKSGAYNPEQGEAAGAVRQKMASTGAEAGSEAAAGLLKLPLSSGGSHIAQPVREQPSEVSTGIARSIGGNVGGMAADPAMWALAALPGEQMGPIFSRLMSGGFAAQMGASKAKEAQELARNWDSLSKEQRAEGITNIGIGAALTALTATHAISGVGQLPGKVAEGVKPIADATVRTGAKIYEGSRKAAPGIGAGVGAASGLATGNPAGVALGLLAGERAGRIAERYLPSAEKAKTYGYSPTEKAVSVHTDLASKADKEAAKAEEAHSVYSASEQAHPEWATADPKELKKTNPAYAASREVVENARAKQAEAHYHLQEAKSADVAAKTAAPSVPDQPITAEAVAAARPAPTEGPLAVPEVQPGVSPAHATTINPQEPLAAPRVEETTQPRPLAEGKGVLMGRPPRMLTEGVPEQAPAVPEAPREVPPVMTAGKPERPSMGGLKVDNTGKVVDTTAGPEAATREALGVERPTKMVQATEGKAVPPEGPLAKYTPEKAPAEAPKEAPRIKAASKTEPGLLGTEKELKNEGRTPEDTGKAEKVVNQLPNQELQNLGNRFGLSTKTEDYDFSKREPTREGGSKHAVDRDRFHKDLMEKLPEALVDKLVASEAAWDKDNPQTFDEPSRSSKFWADRSKAIVKDALTKYQDDLAAKGQAGGSVGLPKIESQAVGFGRKGGMPNVNEEGKWGDITSEHPKITTSGEGSKEPTKPYKDMTPAEQEALAAKGQSGASGKNEEGVGGLERWQGKNPLDKSSTRPTTERINLPADTGKEQPFRPEDKPWDEQLLAARKEVNQSKMSPAQRAAAQEKLAKGGQGGGSGRTLPSGDALLKKYGESSGDPADVSFILKDGRAVASSDMDHDTMLGGKATDKQPAREQFVQEGGIRVRPRVDEGEREVSLSIPPKGVTTEQLNFVKKMAPQLGSGNVVIENGERGGDYRTLNRGDVSAESLEKTIKDLGPKKPLETPKEFKEKPEEPKGSPEHTYTYEQSGDSHQVTVRDPEGKSVALITAREEKPGIWTTKFSASSEHGEGFKGYTRLMDAAKAEAQRSGKPVTVRGDNEMTPAAVRTWGKLGDSYDISWNKEHRPSVTFRPTKMNAEGSKMK